VFNINDINDGKYDEMYDEDDEESNQDQSIIDSIKKLKKNEHLLLQIESVGHVFFIEYYDEYLRILSLYDGLHGFNDYLTNSVGIKHNYGQWFKIKDHEQFIHDMNILNCPIEIIEQYKKLDETLVNMWGIGLNNKPHGTHLSSLSARKIKDIGFNRGFKIVSINKIIDKL